MTNHPWADVVETHSAAVYFAGDRAVKVRKPVRFPFLDLRTHAQRRRACQEEVRLNRRLSPDVYLGVGNISLPGLRAEPCVVMRRLPAETRLSTLVTGHAAAAGPAVRAVAARLARLHEQSPARSDIGSAEQLSALWREALDVLSTSGCVHDTEPVDELDRRSRDYIAGRGELFSERIRQGFVRDGHGDLVADDIFVLADGPRIIDCLDFDEALRCGDVLLDAAFLAMDLERLGSPQLAHEFLATYAEHAHETHPRSLAHFYVAYRAVVRAKVGALRWAQGDATRKPVVEQLINLALQHLRAAGPTLAVVGGLPGAGKTTFARAMAEENGATVVATDVLRKAAGARRVAYTPDAKDSVYRAVLDKARQRLQHGESVVADATWSSERWRVQAREVARETHSGLAEICCTVDDAVAAKRLAERDDGLSDADVGVRRLLRQEFDPWPQATTVDTAAGTPQE